MLLRTLKLGLTLAIFILTVTNAQAETNLPIPRFVTIKATEANIRTGPSIRYPVLWVYNKRWLPVEITAEFEQWRKIRDKDGDEGWIHESLLSGRRYIFIAGKEPTVIYRLPDLKAHPMLKAAPGVMGELIECRDAWCKIDITETSGWVERKALWGVYKNEVIE